MAKYPKMEAKSRLAHSKSANPSFVELAGLQTGAVDAGFLSCSHSNEVADCFA